MKDVYSRPSPRPGLVLSSVISSHHLFIAWYCSRMRKEIKLEQSKHLLAGVAKIFNNQIWFYLNLRRGSIKANTTCTICWQTKLSVFCLFINIRGPNFRILYSLHGLETRGGYYANGKPTRAVNEFVIVYIVCAML